VIVDATGPFQSYARILSDPMRGEGGNRAESIISISRRLRFRQRRRAISTEAARRLRAAGVSSFPVLTRAVVRQLSEGMAARRHRDRRDRTFTYAMWHQCDPRNRKLWRQAGRDRSRPRTSYALIDSKRYTIAPPGKLPLFSVRFSLVDVRR